MKWIAVLCVCLMTGCGTVAERPSIVDNSKSPYVKVRNVSMTAVEWTDGFWADRFELCKTAMLPQLHTTLLDTACSAQLNRLKFMAGLHDTNPEAVEWSDGDCYKWIEAMAHVYASTGDVELDKLMDEWIAIIALAQEEDGYISTNIGHEKSERLKRPNRHELYNMGHLLTTACIHYRATGKESFLAVAKKLGDYLYNEWKDDPDHLVGFPWDPSTYMGLVEMYRTTGEKSYLKVAEIMIDNRGSRPNPDRDHRYGGTDQTQDRVPLREESIAVGHAVCGTYLWAGAADLYAETGDQEIYAALQRIWKDITLRKIDITGGVAEGTLDSPRSDPLHEAFGLGYHQPNGYNETCANIGQGMWSWRMLAVSGDAKYGDQMENVAYNCLNASVDIKGENWFYCNPISWDGTVGEKHHTGERWRTNNCYCCPPSVVRTTAKIHNWVYGVSDDGLWVHMYGGNTLKSTLADGSPIALVQETDYPWDGKIKITLTDAGSSEYSIRLRIPGWADDAGVKLNGSTVDVSVEPGTYAKIHRQWKVGDVIELNLPMPVRLMEANPKVTDLRGRVAVMRGPLVYCLELPKNEGGEDIWNAGVIIPENIKLTVEHRSDFLGGMNVLNGTALTHKGRELFEGKTNTTQQEASDDWGNVLYRPLEARMLPTPEQGTVEVSLVPYYAWANRGLSMMDVWLPLAR
jgi:uncharacterized protein